MPYPSAATSSQQQGVWRVLVPHCQHLTNRDTAVITWSIVPFQTWVVGETGNSQWRNKKKINKQKCQSLGNISDPSVLKFSGCANTVRKPFPRPRVLIPSTSLLSGMLSAASFRGCSLDCSSYLAIASYFSWDSSRKHFLKTCTNGEQHFLL